MDYFLIQHLVTLEVEWVRKRNRVSERNREKEKERKKEREREY